MIVWSGTTSVSVETSIQMSGYNSEDLNTQVRDRESGE